MKRLLTVIVVLAISGVVGLAQGGRTQEHWVGAWSTAVVVATPVAAPAPGRGAPPPTVPGQPAPGAQNKDVTWLRPDGLEFGDVDWRQQEMRVLGMLIDGAATDDVDVHGHAVHDDTLLLVVNAGEAPVPFTLPAVSTENIWVTMIDTSREEHTVVRNGTVTIAAHSLLLLRHATAHRTPVARRDTPELQTRPAG